MDYQVWIKDEFGDTWTRKDCGDLEATKREVDKAVRNRGEPLLTVEVPYTLNIKVGEIGSEISKGKPKTDKGPGAEGKGKVRPGDTTAISELSEGSRDSSPDNLLPSQ